MQNGIHTIQSQTKSVHFLYLLFVCLATLWIAWSCIPAYLSTEGAPCVQDSDCLNGEFCEKNLCSTTKTREQKKAEKFTAQEDAKEPPVKREPSPEQVAPRESTRDTIQDGGFSEANPEKPSRPDLPSLPCKEKDTRTCYSASEDTQGVGPCKVGTQVCDAKGKWSSCKDAIIPTKEKCDGKDNDCDGTTDEGCSCKSGTKRSCGTDKGPCKKGSQTCTKGKWGSCQGGISPQSEVCNGKDDNCDGKVDNMLVESLFPCDTKKFGLCRTGKATCSKGKLQCTPAYKAQVESCDNKDNDCDGKVDELLTQLCFTGPSGCKKQGKFFQCQGECKAGRQTCNAGKWGACRGSIEPLPEVCNGKDDNCDGKIDEVCGCVDGTKRACGIGIGECEKGEQACEKGIWLICKGDKPPQREVCNGKDDDCDGTIDNNITLNKQCPIITGNLCKQGAQSCSNSKVECRLTGTFDICKTDADCAFCGTGFGCVTIQNQGSDVKVCKKP